MSKFEQIRELYRESADLLLIFDRDVNAYDELFGLHSSDFGFHEAVLNLQRIALHDLKQFTERTDVNRIMFEESLNYLYVFYIDDYIETFEVNTLDSDTCYCSYCGKGFNEGFCVFDGQYYFCSEECLENGFGIDNFNEVYVDGGDTFHSTWFFNDGRY